MVVNNQSSNAIIPMHRSSLAVSVIRASWINEQLDQMSENLHDNQMILR